MAFLRMSTGKPGTGTSNQRRGGCLPLLPSSGLIGSCRSHRRRSSSASLGDVGWYFKRKCMPSAATCRSHVYMPKTSLAT